MDIRSSIPLLVGVLVVAGCSGSTTSTEPAADSGTPAVVSSPAAPASSDLTPQLDALCGANDFFPRAENPQYVVRDFSGDGVEDAVAGFDCFTEIDRLSGGYVYYWGSEANREPVQLLGDQTESQGLAPWQITSVAEEGSSIVVQYVQSDGDPVVSFAWTGDGFTRSESQQAAVDNLRDLAEIAVPGWDLAGNPVDEYSIAAETLFAKKPLYDSAGYFALFFRYASSADATSDGESSYLDTVLGNAEEAMYGLVPFSRVTCDNVVVVIRQELSAEVMSRLNDTYGCS